MNKTQALHSFWSGFGLTAYDATSVPDDAQMPYITYEALVDDFGNVTYQTASLWYHSTSWSSITEKEQQIAGALKHGGKMVPFLDGSMWIQKGTPWAQRLSDPNDRDVRRIVLNVVVEFLD